MGHIARGFQPGYDPTSRLARMLIACPCIETYSFISVLTHCQMNENPRLNQEIHVLFEHGFKLLNTSNKPRVIYDICRKCCGPE